MKLTYLAHSGFTVETASKILVFDYYQDDKGIVAKYATGTKPLWIFVTHWHGDHFNRHIADFNNVAQFIVNNDVALRNVPAEKLHVMHVYDTITIDDVTVTQYGSTDEGGSFLVQTDDSTIFHAGDLNWWHWLGDTDENNADAKRMFDAEMARLKGLSFDVVFFPVDARLEAAREWGVVAFLDYVKVTKCLVPMHYFGEPWQPSDKFKARFNGVPVWIPRQNGDAVTIDL